MANKVKQVNLEQGMPSVPVALRRLESELYTAKRLGFAAVKLIHGYGSSGVGGKLRVAVRQELEKRRRLGQLTAVIPGEKFSIFEEETRLALNRCGSLRQDRDLDRYNNGVTFVLL